MGRVAAGPRDTRSPALRTSTARPRPWRAAAALGLALGLAQPSVARALAPDPAPVLAPPQGPPQAPDAARTPAERPSQPQRPAAPPARRIPRDPNDLPPMPEPEGQPASDVHRRDVDHTTARSSRRRVVLTVAPAYASLRLPLLGRPPVPVRGGGFAAAAQVAVWRPLGLRATVAHTMHPLDDHFVRNDDDQLVQTAGAGLLQATHAGLSATYTLDLGRVLTTLDAGAGAIWLRTPEAIQDGQLGGTCRPEAVCDTGLVCGADNMCHVGVTPQIHGGFAVDVLLGDRFAVGGELRYFALLSAPTSYPVYLLAALRASLRF